MIFTFSLATFRYTWASIPTRWFFFPLCQYTNTCPFFSFSKMQIFLWFLLFRWLHLDILERLFRHDDFSSPYVSTQTLVLFFTPKNCVFYFSWVSFWYTWVSIPKHSVCRIFIGFGTDLPSCFLKPNLWKCRRLS